MNCLTSCCGGDENDVNKTNEMIINQSNNNIINEDNIGKIKNENNKNKILEEENNNAMQKKEKLGKEVSGLTNQLDLLKEQISKAELQKSNLDKQILAKQSEINKQNKTIEENGPIIDQLNDKIRVSSQECEKLQNDIESLRVAKSKFEMEVNKIKSEKALAEQQYQQTINNHNKVLIGEKKSLLSLQQKLEKSNKQIQQYNKQLDAVKAEYQKLETHKNELQNKIDEIGLDIEQKLQLANDYKNAITTSQSQYQDIETNIAHKVMEITKTYKTTIKELEQKKDNLNKEYNRLIKENSRLNAKNKILFEQNNKHNIINKVKTFTITGKKKNFTITGKKKNVYNINRKRVNLDNIDCGEVINDIDNNKK